MAKMRDLAADWMPSMKSLSALVHILRARIICSPVSTESLLSYLPCLTTLLLHLRANSTSLVTCPKVKDVRGGAGDSSLESIGRSSHCW